LREAQKVIVGQNEALDGLIVALLAQGHALLEGVPGTAKTLMVRTVAGALGLEFGRIQFTPDLMPSDVVGTNVFDLKAGAFRLTRGPIFTELLLADEINRAPAKTQSALLEAMAESQVSVEGQRRPLPDIFFVIATQNPVEFRGTYPLPEAQMDRFALQLELGYLDPEEECALLAAQARDHPLDRIVPCATIADLVALRRAVQEVRVSDEVRRYVVDLVGMTRKTSGVRLGASPRASLALMKTSQALALFDGLECVTPHHVQTVAVPALAHRLVLDPQALYSGQNQRGIVNDILKQVPVPV
jgi:MoxR-like ATPase